MIIIDNHLGNPKLINFFTKGYSAYATTKAIKNGASTDNILLTIPIHKSLIK